MIAKMVKGRGFRGALEYDLQAGKSVLLETNLAGQTPRAMAKEFGEVRQLRPTLGKAVVHVSLSLHAGEHLTDAQWRDIAHQYLMRMGFTDNQYVVTRHTDTAHEHIHILANRITLAGDVVSDSQDWKRQEAFMRALERDYHLIADSPSQKAERKAPTKGEIEYALRTGQASIKQRLQGLCDAAMQGCTSLSDYIERLVVTGVDVIPTVQLNGAKVSGLMYRLDGTVMKGSDLGKAYSPAGLAKRGVTYEQNRDFATVNQCRERAARRAFDATNRDLAPSEGSERGGAGRDAGTLGPSDGRANGRDAGDVGSIAGAERPTDGRLSESESEYRKHVATQHPTDGRGGPESESNQPTPDADRNSHREPSHVAAGMETLRPDDNRRGLGRDAHHRIVALAVTHADSSYPALQAERDRTAQAIQRQLQAFGVDRFDVGIRDGQQGKMMNRLWTPDEVLKSAAWLKRMNAKGNDIYVKPAGEHGLVLVDDLTPEALARLKGQGFNPAIVTETSPGNLQAWLK
ncbi:MAG: relaxase/mobilization nuclease domain-containing protein, partial [Firmicutes bacterium]|nr:relaxase/mobilization nuclease domain-containing protein [Bacillota bacterium]